MEASYISSASHVEVPAHLFLFVLMAFITSVLQKETGVAKHVDLHLMVKAPYVQQATLSELDVMSNGSSALCTASFTLLIGCDVRS